MSLYTLDNIIIFKKHGHTFRLHSICFLLAWKLNNFNNARYISFRFKKIYTSDYLGDLIILRNLIKLTLRYKREFCFIQKQKRQVNFDGPPSNKISTVHTIDNRERFWAGSNHLLLKA